MQELLFTFAKLVTAGNYPVLISTITLIASLSMRNAHLSDRSRSVVDEMLYKLKDAEPALKESRFYSLSQQNVKFIERYVRTCRAIVSAVFAVFSFAVTMACVTAFEKTASTAVPSTPSDFLYYYGAIVFALLGLVSFTLSLLATLNEFRYGPVTLKWNDKVFQEAEIRNGKPPEHRPWQKCPTRGSTGRPMSGATVSGTLKTNLHRETQ